MNSKLRKVKFKKQHASVLSWSLSPAHSRPDLMEYEGKIKSLMTEINSTVKQIESGHSYNQLMKSIAPLCREFILECSLNGEGNAVRGKQQSINGTACCDRYFNPIPVFNRYGKSKRAIHILSLSIIFDCAHIWLNHV